MSEDIIQAKPQPLLKVCNILLMLINLWVAFIICMFIIIIRKNYFDPHSGVFMGAPFADFISQKHFIILPVLFTVGMIIKEFKVKLLKKKVYINLLIMAALLIYAFIFMYFYP